MSKANITTNVRRNNGIGIIDIGGEVNAYAEDALAAAYSEASQNGVKAIVLNFSGLEYMNSSGIGLLVTLLIRAQRNKQRLLACGLNEHYQQIFALTRLNEAIGIYASEAAAAAAA
ncbi:MAG TPA: STAS domain-containing protein [Anaerolineae bacterium]|mgnify:FL=1|nr:STAS domain-containing protein [Anaerolineae bacterium]